MRIFRIHNEDKIGWMQELIDTSKPRAVIPPPKEKNDQVIVEEIQPDNDSGCNRQVQFINHHFPASGNDDTKMVVFIITNMFK